MRPELLNKYDRQVPRYTSYPTAPHFHDGVDGEVYGRWMSELEDDASLSLYIHVPFCRSLCWFCGCHMKVVNRYGPIADYQTLLLGEIDLVAQKLPGRRWVTHVHFGGGTPTAIAADDFEALIDVLRQRFDFAPDAEVAVEVDPRTLDQGIVDAMARSGVTRASLGVQDVNQVVQEAINRKQPFSANSRAFEMLRQAGISAINVDLMFGLPHQDVKKILWTVDLVAGLGPDRISLFGYAHVPWMKRHQRLIDEASLPDARERLACFEAAAARLGTLGYVPIGLDHFALPGDPLVKALREGRLHRNFQGYTTDEASALIGLGASAIGALPQGYVQNIADSVGYRDAIRGGRLATARGVVLSQDDRLRRVVIERLMCDLEVDLGETCERFGRSIDDLAPALEGLAHLQDDGLVDLEAGTIVRVPQDSRPLLRVVCAAFDSYLDDSAGRHARSV
ncbi:MAG: oxygen-independent coproporphyrinogen III oxidase [Alphaproteobacteria bacterium]|jgi:oxygen-independent coproporphyrinogen-3 oxidase|nr:oxygen-independent coproporphyrinogen III oxidase [Alphaproteobacteria bacterium]MDP6604268.1 oxygen-independent coproporphyrinogen III oxidase [Rhodospirillales bacterium]